MVRDGLIGFRPVGSDTELGLGRARSDGRTTMSFGLFFFVVVGLLVPIAGVVWILRSSDR